MGAAVFSITEGGEIVDKKVVVVSVVLLVSGLLALAATVYQEKVAGSDEDPHMGIPATGKYEWRTHSAPVTGGGIISVLAGVVLLVKGFIHKNE